MADYRGKLKNNLSVTEMERLVLSCARHVNTISIVRLTGFSYTLVLRVLKSKNIKIS